MKDLALVPGSAHPLAMVEVQPGAALVTGAAHRIGQAIAEDLAGRGWAVALHYHRSRETAMAMATRIIAAGGQATAVPADLTDEEEAADLVPRAAAAVGPLDCLINNAAVFENDDIETATHESWDTHILTNLRAPLILTQTFAAQLDGQVSGNVINLLDQRVWNLTPHFLSYTVSKAGLWALTQTAALALAPRIRVNAIGPGPTLPSRRQSPAQFADQSAALPLARGTTPEEICDAVRFILAAPALTGQMIALDGGQHLGWSHPDTPRGVEE